MRYVEILSEPELTVPMIMHCPICSGRHIDEGEFLEKPHHTHACQHCGHVWRPTKVNTHGVQFLPGYKNGDVELRTGPPISANVGERFQRFGRWFEVVEEFDDGRLLAKNVKGPHE